MDTINVAESGVFSEMSARGAMVAESGVFSVLYARSTLLLVNCPRTSYTSEDTLCAASRLSQATDTTHLNDPKPSK